MSAKGEPEASGAILCLFICLSSGSDGKESPCNVRDLGSIPGLGRSPGGGHGNPLQYSYLDTSMDKGAWPAAIHGVTKVLGTTEQLKTAQPTHSLNLTSYRSHCGLLIAFGSLITPNKVEIVELL